MSIEAAHLPTTPGARLRALLQRENQVLSVMHPINAGFARIMEQAGCEVGFVGTGSVVGGYTGFADVGVTTMMECVTVGGWIAQAVKFPVILDGDTGHGGIMAVRRLVRESIRAGLAGIRIDDQPLEGKRRTGSTGIEVIPVEQAIARYRAAVDMKNEIDPSFVIMAQCYARDAVNGGIEDALVRLAAYEQEAGVDWVQLEAPASIEEIRRARAVVKGHFSFMKGTMPGYLSLAEHLEVGTNIAWLPSFTHQVLWAALSDFLADFSHRGIEAWNAFNESRKDNPYFSAMVGPDGEGAAKQQALEERYRNGKY